MPRHVPQSLCRCMCVCVCVWPSAMTYPTAKMLCFGIYRNFIIDLQAGKNKLVTKITFSSAFNNKY